MSKLQSDKIPCTARVGTLISKSFGSKPQASWASNKCFKACRSPEVVVVVVVADVVVGQTAGPVTALHSVVIPSYHVNVQLDSTFGQSAKRAQFPTPSISNNGSR